MDAQRVPVDGHANADADLGATPPRPRRPRIGQPVRCAAAALVVGLVAALAGCQSAPVAMCTAALVPVYATADDAQAVAAGNFGAVPLTLAGAADLRPADGTAAPSTTPSGASSPRSALVAAVRTQGGQLGWVVQSTLPGGWPQAAGCRA